jgi:hexosaminidase
MVDVARHFIPLKKLFNTVDGMEAAKYNVLHLHLTDAQSFPVRFQNSPLFPNISNLADMSSFRPESVYSLADLRQLVEYAAERGVEVVPEIDVPAHTK